MGTCLVLSDYRGHTCRAIALVRWKIALMVDRAFSKARRSLFAQAIAASGRLDFLRIGRVSNNRPLPEIGPLKPSSSAAAIPNSTGTGNRCWARTTVYLNPRVRRENQHDHNPNNRDGPCEGFLLVGHCWPCMISSSFSNIRFRSSRYSFRKSSKSGLATNPRSVASSTSLIF